MVFRIVLHVVIFVAAFFIYILGLGGGLAVNPALERYCGRLQAQSPWAMSYGYCDIADPAG